MTSRRTVQHTASAPWKEFSRSHAADSTVDEEVTQQSDVDVLQSRPDRGHEQVEEGCRSTAL